VPVGVVEREALPVEHPVPIAARSARLTVVERIGNFR
jgi:hypothetical protein